jgi:hypothetical protein
MSRDLLEIWIRARVLPAARAGLSRARRAARRRPQAVLGAALVAGVVVMILHWS